MGPNPPRWPRPLAPEGIEQVVAVAQIVHRSVALTLQQYAHRWAGDQRSALARLREAQ
jgi:hypothetical protein